MLLSCHVSYNGRVSYNTLLVHITTMSIINISTMIVMSVTVSSLVMIDILVTAAIWDTMPVWVIKTIFVIARHVGYDRRITCHSLIESGWTMGTLVITFVAKHAAQAIIAILVTIAIWVMNISCCYGHVSYNYHISCYSHICSRLFMLAIRVRISLKHRVRSLHHMPPHCDQSTDKNKKWSTDGEHGYNNYYAYNTVWPMITNMSNSNSCGHS